MQNDIQFKHSPQCLVVCTLPGLWADNHLGHSTAIARLKPAKAYYIGRGRHFLYIGFGCGARLHDEEVCDLRSLDRFSIHICLKRKAYILVNAHLRHVAQLYDTVHVLL